MTTFNEIVDKLYNVADKSATIYAKVASAKPADVINNNVIPINDDVRYSTSGTQQRIVNDESADERRAQTLQNTLLIGSGVLLITGVVLLAMGGRK